VKRYISITFLFFLSLSSFPAQRYPHNYTEYAFLNTNENKINFYNNSNWEYFFNKTKSQWREGGQKINIVHFGGSHIQADVWSNRMRQHFQNISLYNNSGRGMIFPFRIIGSNGSPYLKTNHSGTWRGFRNSVSKHNTPFGLLGARATLLDSTSTIHFWINRDHCSDCFFDELEFFYKDSLNNHCIEIISDSLKWIKENIEKQTTTFKLSELTDSVSVAVRQLDSLGKFDFFGLRIANNHPGICYHSVGVNGASVPSYLRCEFLSTQLSSINPDLIIFSIGINDAYEPSFSKDIFKLNYDSIIQIVKAVNPNVAILLTTNNDSYYRRKTPNKRALLVKEAMYELAKKHDAAVWDLFEIMGGLNSISKWEKNGLAKKDKIHLTPDGYKLVGDLLFEAILNAYKDYVEING
jgi:lysophospholipase L1-like esterase